jgi:hypothetical protein
MISLAPVNFLNRPLWLSRLQNRKHLNMTQFLIVTSLAESFKILCFSGRIAEAHLSWHNELNQAIEAYKGIEL